MVLILGCWCSPANAQNTTPTPKTQPAPRHHTIIVKTPVGRPYLMLGAQTALWFGSGDRFALDDDGNIGARIDTRSAQATSIGPFGIGILQVIRPRIAFDARIGLGAVHFDDDALINADLDATNSSHTGFLFNGELRARYLHENGLTAALGATLNSIDLVNSSGGTLNLSSRLGYILWDNDYESFWLLEAGYAYPLVNGLIPEFPDARREPPITSTWHVLEAAVYFGF